MVRFPSIRTLVTALFALNQNVEVESREDACDVRLQVYPDGQWALRFGDASYDRDHRGFWGGSAIPGVFNGRARRFNARDVARDLRAQARAHAADNECINLDCQDETMLRSIVAHHGNPIMRAYAEVKLSAIRCRLAGNIPEAVRFETMCEGHYSRLPSHLRW